MSIENPSNTNPEPSELLKKIWKKHGIKSRVEREKEEKEKQEKLTKGDGFVMGGEGYSANYGGDANPVEFRPEASTEGAIEEKKRRQEEEKERESKKTPTEKARERRDAITRWFNQCTTSKAGIYSETLKIKLDGTLDKDERLDGHAPYIIIGFDLESVLNTPKDLYQMMHQISSEHPEFNISFEADPNGKWIKYLVTKKPPKVSVEFRPGASSEKSIKKVEIQKFAVGDEVFWENQGVNQWEEPRKIKSIQEDPKSKRKYAFVEGGATGIPLDELIPSKK